MSPPHHPFVLLVASGGCGVSSLQPIDARCGGPQNRIVLFAAERRRRRAKSIDEFAIAGPELFDRKIGAEQAPLGAKDRNGLGDNFGDMGGIVAVNERAKS